MGLVLSLFTLSLLRGLSTVSLLLWRGPHDFVPKRETTCWSRLISWLSLLIDVTVCGGSGDVGLVASAALVSRADSDSVVCSLVLLRDGTAWSLVFYVLS